MPGQRCSGDPLTDNNHVPGRVRHI
jgi:hypothetical protein